MQIYKLIGKVSIQNTFWYTVYLVGSGTAGMNNLDKDLESFSAYEAWSQPNLINTGIATKLS